MNLKDLYATFLSLIKGGMYFWYVFFAYAITFALIGILAFISFRKLIITKRTIYNLRKAKELRNQKELLLQDNKKVVETEVANAWSSYQSSKSVLESIESQVKACLLYTSPSPRDRG